MSDVHLNEGPSLKGTKGQDRQEINADRGQEIDADRATNISEYHQLHEFHDSKYWHTACRVRDCRFGFPECKVGSSCSKPGWKNALEEPLRRSRSLAPASKRLESVAMLPSLLSNLAVSRTHSDPCIFGKDFLRITLPLPGEPSDCGAQELAVEESESSAFENMVSCEPTNFIGLETREDNPVLEASTSSFNLTCEKIMPKTGISSGNESLFIVQNSVARTQDGLGKWSMRSFGDTSFDETAANNPMEGRTPQWETCRSNEWQRRMQGRNTSKEHYLASAEETEMDQAEEDVADEGYLVLEEQEDQQLGSFEDEGDACDVGEEESIVYAKQYNNDDYTEEELLKGEIDTDNSSKGYKEDDIWSDEHFVSSQAKGFPPPISILANETHPGLPGHMPRTLWRSVKRDGRFVLQEVQAQPREFFQATREFGRLRLQLVRPDSDPVENDMEADDMCNKDSSGASIACSSSTENLAGISDTNKSEDCGIVHKGDMSGTCVQGIDTLQPEDCWETEKGGKSGASLDHDGAKLVRGLMSSTSLPKEGGSVLEGETPGACSGQDCTEMFGARLSSDACLKEVPNLGGGDVMTKVSRVTNQSHISQELRGGKMEMLGKSTIHESRFPDSGQREVVKLSEVVKVDNREKPFGCCPSDDVQALAVEIPLDTGHQRIVVQIDGERKVERMGVVNLCTKLDVGQVDKVEDLSKVVMPPTVHGHEEQFRTSLLQYYIWV